MYRGAGRDGGCDQGARGCAASPPERVSGCRLQGLCGVASETGFRLLRRTACAQDEAAPLRGRAARPDGSRCPAEGWRRSLFVEYDGSLALMGLL